MARLRADRLRVAGVLTVAVTALALGLASSAMPAGNGTPSPAQARPAIDAAGVIETVEHHVDPVISSEYPVSDPAATLQSGPGIAPNSGAPSVAFEGTNYLVVWETAGCCGTPQLKGARVNQAGNVLDPAGIPITASDPHTWQVEPSV